ncbi:MAG TPA: hypothetical protein DIW31_02620 [Bacteroidales bacterium]|nr:hypothetical protein [Bacteroidales bacterium]
MKYTILHMKRIRIILLTILGVIAYFSANAQQIPQYTQYMFNNYLTNPAVAGTYNYYQLRVNSRYQWVGLNDAPQTTGVSIFGPLSKRDMGWGSYVFMDITGPTSRMGLMGSYAYNMPINDEFRISGGISLGFLQYKVDRSKFTLGDNSGNYVNFSDPTINSVNSTFTPDATIGFYVYNSLHYLGISAHQLFGQKLNLYNETIGINRLRQHLIVCAGTRYILNRYYDIEPALLLKFPFGSKFQFELNTKVTYKSQMWGGISYRFRDAIAIMIGYNYKKRYMFGYSYDYSYTSIRQYQSGTHEIMIGYLFDKIK